jgi:hypothetical protein
MHIWDRVGTIASAICAVHCFITGIALGLLSYVGLGFFGSLTADLIFLGSAIAIAVIAIRHGISKHHSYVPSLIFVFGLVLVSVGHFGFKHSHDGQGPSPLASLFSVLGGVCFVLFHVVNFLLQRKCHCRHCATGE